MDTVSMAAANSCGALFDDDEEEKVNFSIVNNATAAACLRQPPRCSMVNKRRKSGRLSHRRLIETFGVRTIRSASLQYLSLRNIGLNVINVRVLNCTLKQLPSLKYLDISNCCTGQLHELTMKHTIANSNEQANGNNLIFKINLNNI